MAVETDILYRVYEYIGAGLMRPAPSKSDDFQFFNNYGFHSIEEAAEAMSRDGMLGSYVVLPIIHRYNVPDDLPVPDLTKVGPATQE